MERENQMLSRAVEELAILNELASSIGASDDVQEIMQKIIRRSLKAIDAEQSVITLVGEDTTDPTRTLVRMAASSNEHEAFRPDQSLLGWMHVYKAPLCINKPRHDDRFRGTNWHDSVISILCVPLMVHTQLIGIISIYNKKDPAGFTTDDQRLLSIIASQSAQVVENARLHSEEQKLIRMQEEIRLAYDIQTNLLPKKQPVISGYDIAGISLPAREVGGDYFDFISLDNNQLVLCVGDVSGKGIPAALLMANLQATLRGQTLIDPAPKTCIERSNRLLCESIRKGSFITLFFGLLDSDQHLFRYANAGHNRPMLLKAGRDLTTLPLGDIMLGFKPDYVFREAAVTLEQGDLLLIYSDGITEAMNRQHDQFGEERLFSLLKRHARDDSFSLIDSIVKAVQSHSDDELQSDDMTLLAVKRNF